MKAVGVIGGDGSADVGERSREGGLPTGSDAVRLLKLRKEDGGELVLVVWLNSLSVGERGLAPLNDDAVDRGGVSGYAPDHLPFASHDATTTFTFAALS